MRIGRWTDPRFVFVCQLIEVISDADANETAGEDGLALPDSLVGESQKYRNWSQILSNKVPLLSVELEYHAEWCALKSPSIHSHHHMVQGNKLTSCARDCWGYVDVGNDQLRVSQRCRDGQLLQIRFYQSLW